MTKKDDRIEARRSRVEDLAQEGMVYCTKHEKLLDLETVRFKYCHNGDHGRKYCKHVEFR